MILLRALCFRCLIVMPVIVVVESDVDSDVKGGDGDDDVLRWLNALHSIDQQRIFISNGSIDLDAFFSFLR